MALRVAITVSSSNLNVVTGNDGNRRRTRSLSPLPPRRLHDATNNGTVNVGATHAAKRRKSKRNLFSTCDGILNLPRKLHCSGCNHFMDFGTKPRDEYTSYKCQCYKAWTKKAADVPKIRLEHWKGVTNYIEKELEIALESLIEEEEQVDNNVEAPQLEETTTTTPAVTPAGREVRMELNAFWSYGKQCECWIPHTHKIVNSAHNKRWENEVNLLARVRSKIQSSCFTTGSAFSQTLFGIAMASAPALALSAAQHLMPTFMMAFFCDTGLFNNINLNEYASSFPSDWFLRKCNWHQATRDTMSLGKASRNKRIYLACDKGNKRKVGHFVKALSWWRPLGGVHVQVLDIDASGGTTVDCALAMQASINKLKVNDTDQTHLLGGQATDSGGGGCIGKLGRRNEN